MSLTLAEWTEKYQKVWKETAYSNVGYLAESLFQQTYHPINAPVNDCSAFAARVHQMVHDSCECQYWSTGNHGALTSPENIMIDSSARTAFSVGPNRWPNQVATTGKDRQWWIDGNGDVCQQRSINGQLMDPPEIFHRCSFNQTMAYSRMLWRQHDIRAVFLFRVWNDGDAHGAYRGMITFDRYTKTITARINTKDIITMAVDLDNFTKCWEGLGLWVEHMIGATEREQWSQMWWGRSISEIFGEIVFQWLDA
ncbi:hypothetical protein K440DRAFT_621362 [Wilcoxina mikolae CBS 423.85]|nr:hypothetical protein K440DRAFT_621362 [Wilcoxina mikolae CBS 423.85]